MMLLGEAVKKENYGDVIELCEAGVETNPEMLEFYFYLAIAYNQAERTDDVISICQPESIDANYGRTVRKRLFRTSIPFWEMPTIRKI